MSATGQKLIVLDGEPATGKTTWLDAEKARLGGVVVSNLKAAVDALIAGEKRVYLDPNGKLSVDIEVKHFTRREVFEVDGVEFA
jgi:hypothetical protein